MNLLIKPASGACNMRCSYCFYADEMAHRKQGVLGMMSTETLDTIVEKSLRYARDSCAFMFQGGEPTLAGLDFYRGLIDSVGRHNRRALPISYAIQTNGYALDDTWADFFSKHKFLVGLSLDGPRDIHDENRRGADGGGSFSRVTSAAALLERHRVDFNILTVVTRRSARAAVSIYNYFANQGFRYQQFIPCIEGFGTGTARNNANSGALDSELYGKFLCRLFDIWYADIMSGKYVYNRTFENWVGILLGRPPENCGMAGVCSVQYVVEADGSVYPCDFYVLDSFRLGSLLTDSFEEIDRRRNEIGFIEASAITDPACTACEYRTLCRGGCRRDREGDSLPFCGTRNGMPAGETLVRNRYCEAYRTFFPYATARLATLAGNVRRYGGICPR